MKASRLLLAACLTAATLPLTSRADTDMTGFFLKNAGFDSNFDYNKVATGNVAQEIRDVDGWTKDIGIDYTITGVYEYGTQVTFNSTGRVPARGFDGSAGCLALSTGWDQSLKYYQTVTLPKGSYRLTSAFWNGSTQTAGKSLVGWIPASGSAVMSAIGSFPLNSWTTDELSFTLSGPTTGKVQIGFLATSGGSVNSAKVVLDYVRLIMTDDAAALSYARQVLQDVVTAARTELGDMGGDDAGRLRQTLDEAQDVADSSTDVGVILATKNALETTVATFWNEHISADHPQEQTERIANASFENGFSGWTQENMQTQTNSEFAKDGNTYVEKWVQTSNVGDALVCQTLHDLPNGVYLLRATAQNLLQSDTSARQSGAVIFAGDHETAVTARATYDLLFTHIDGEATIGFRATKATGNWIAVDNFRLYYCQGTLADQMAELNSRADEAERLMRQTANAKGTEALAAIIRQARAAQTEDDITAAARLLRKGIFAFRLANATGTAPTVETGTIVAGATMLFGRLATKGATAAESGLCWSKDNPQPTLTDNYSSTFYTNNGNIYYAADLEPGTFYYVRAYAMTSGYAVGYGDVVKVPTLPKGKVTWTYGKEGDSNTNARIQAAVEDAVGVINSTTQIKNFNLSVHYVYGAGAGDGTADCSYGGYMRISQNASYQRTGTVLHEGGHGMGVGTSTPWTNNATYRASTSSGRWLGERVDRVMRFLENNDDAFLNGDGMHMWPYGINGAHEDTGARMLYHANAMVHEALGEDGLIISGSTFILPAYTFAQDDNKKYYLKSESPDHGLQTAYLRQVGYGTLKWMPMSCWDALANDSCAWNITFDPATGYYTLRNVGTGRTLVKSSTSSAFTLSSYPNETNKRLQLLGARSLASMETDGGTFGFSAKGYWVLTADNHMALAASAQNATAGQTFSHANSATAQRWIIMDEAEVKRLAEAVEKHGDVNGDKTVTIADVTTLVNVILGRARQTGAADINRDGIVSIADVTALVNIILGKQR